MKMKDDLARGTLIGLAGITVWSTSGVLIAYLLRNFPLQPLQLALWRNLFVVFALGLVLAVGWPHLLRLQTRFLGFMAIYGLVLSLFNAIWTVSLRENGAAVATVLGYSSAGFTVVLAYFLFGERIGPFKAAAVVFSLGGCALVANAFDASVWQLQPIGIISGLLSGVIFSVYTLFGKQGARMGLHAFTSLFYSFLFGTLFIFIFNLIPFIPGSGASTTGLLPIIPPEAWGWMAFVAVGPTLLGFGLYNLSMDHLPASVANLLATTEPVMTAIEAYIFLGERLTPMQLAGSLVILAAVVLVQKGAKET